LLTQEQKLIVESNDKNILILSNAGTGKTFTVVEKLKHLINIDKINPERILLTSFSRVAASELYEKTKEKIGEALASKITIGTIHAICYKVVLENLDKLNMKAINIVTEAYLSGIVFNRNPKLFSSRKEAVKITSMYRRYLLTKQYPASADMREFNAVAEAQELMEAEGKILFDDLMIKTVDIFKKYPEIHTKWKNKFDVTITDEAQDTSQIQWDILYLLLNENSRTIVVGDPKQTLYSFRGCDHSFMNDYRIKMKAKIFTLSETFRFGQEFADMSNKIIENLNIDMDYKKETVTNVNCTNTPHLHHIYTEDQPTHVIEDINKKLTEGFQYKDCNIVYRYNKESVPFMKKLIEAGIPFETKSGDVFERIELRFILKCYSLIKNFNISDTIELFSMYPNFIGDKTMTSLFNSVTDNHSILSVLEEATKGKIDGVGFKKLESLRDMKDRISILNKYIHATESRVNFQEISRIMNMDETKFMLKELEDMDNPSEDRFEFLEFFQENFEKSEFSSPLDWFNDVSINGHKVKETEKNKVQLKTVHGCKGQSLPIVYLIANRICDTRFINTEEAIEQEKFVWYVATTRAEKHMEIYISDPKRFKFNFIFPKEWIDKFLQDVEQEQTNEKGEFEISSNTLKQLQENYRAKKRTYKSVLNTECVAIATTDRAIQFQQGTTKIWLPISTLGYGDSRFFLDEWIIKKNSYQKFVEKY
jgi:DNA helicase-2/ATP-dependent DNA helicase PcrA